MTQCKIFNNDLHIIFIESDETPISVRLDNGTEIEFINDEVSVIILSNFMLQLPMGINFNKIWLESIQEIDEDLVQIELRIQDGETINSINAKLDISSLNRKVYI